MRISDWSSDVCSSDLVLVTICSVAVFAAAVAQARGGLLAQPSMAPGLAIVATVAAVGGLLLVDRGVRHGKIGRASCRDRVCQYVSIAGDAGSLKNSMSITSSERQHTCTS